MMVDHVSFGGRPAALGCPSRSARQTERVQGLLVLPVVLPPCFLGPVLHVDAVNGSKAVGGLEGLVGVPELVKEGLSKSGQVVRR